MKNTQSAAVAGSPFPVFPSSYFLLPSSFLILLCLLWCSAEQARGQQPKGGNANQKPKEALKTVFYGVVTCAGCHSQKRPEDTKGLPPVLCRCNEALTWSDFDKHKVAYTNVFKPGGRGEQMKKLLHYTDKDVNKNCVVCHGVYIPEDKIDSLADASFKRDQSEGVTCVACHGAYENWVLPHGSPLAGQREAWRKLSRQEKEDKYGMTDLWDAGKRTHKCASCHIGSTEEGKVVTHAMYAAGHPPLPGLEVATFSNAMPRHWQYLREKKQQAQTLLNFDPKELEVTKLVLVGGVVELQESLTLLATQAESKGKDKEPAERVLDLAQFDCYACHHDLKTPSWRQERGYFGTPGRPQFRPWPLALVKLAIHHSGQADDAKELDEGLRRLHRAFDVQPFGRLENVGTAARDLTTWTKKLRERLNGSTTKYDQSSALSLLRQLVVLSQSEIPDYDSARQIAWAFAAIYADWNPSFEKNAEFHKKWKALDAELALSLPSTQQQEILGELPRTLNRISEYDPTRFKKALPALGELLSKP
jgi:hypothetical protein